MADSFRNAHGPARFSPTSSRTTDLEIPDEQCQVLVSVTGMAARTAWPPRPLRRVQTRPTTPFEHRRGYDPAAVAVITSDAQILP